MAETAPARKAARLAREHEDARRAILDAARKLASRDGARNLSLRRVAAEAGYAPAALYGYFRNRDELLFALAADDITTLARQMREAARQGGGLKQAATTAFAHLCSSETLAAASTALGSASETSEAERLLNGRLIGVLTALSDAAGGLSQSREGQRDVLLIAAAIAGLALLSRTGRLSSLGFSADELIERISARFPSGS
jgi:AcrR family transcriptional regulator